jgi:energy-coupling factor transporter transmembrane protein EcfT
VGTLLYSLGIPDEPRLVWWRLGLSLPGARVGLLGMLRMVGLFGLGVIGARWIQPREYMPWIGRKPRRLFIVSSMIRLVPLLRDDLDRIRLSQAARGHEPSRGWFRAGSLLPVLVPLFVSTLRRAREQAISMELAGLNARRSP